MMDKEREAFEAWAQSEGQDIYRNGIWYRDSYTSAMWEGWQARAKQTITLTVKDATGEH